MLVLFIVIGVMFELSNVLGGKKKDLFKDKWENQNLIFQIKSKGF